MTMTSAAMNARLKEIYVNSRLRSLPVAAPASGLREWIFSDGDRWLLLTPPRLFRLALLLGLKDVRVNRILSDVRRWHPRPEEFCEALGVKGGPQLAPGEYPAVVCPGCDSVHHPHPEEAARLCPECSGRGPSRSPGRDRDERRDGRIRARLMREAPEAFDNGVLRPNWRINNLRRLERDWDGAVNRVLLGMAYRDVARKYGCSVGLLHRKVCEAKYWEWN